MNSSHNQTTQSVLTSWKEIAQYMGKGVRTVQRWERDFGLPVRRPSNSDKKAVLARPLDLDIWVAMRCRSRTPCAGDESLLVRCSLAGELETARMLRESNRVMRSELRSALGKLRDQLTQMCGKVA